jgi:DmsE family decaheme c-type cytochrome
VDYLPRGDLEQDARKPWCETYVKRVKSFIRVGEVAAAGQDRLGYYVAQYDGEIAAADAEVGRILDALTASPARNRTVVVIASDHGESLGEHDDYFDHGENLFTRACGSRSSCASPERPREDESWISPPPSTSSPRSWTPSNDPTETQDMIARRRPLEGACSGEGPIAETRARSSRHWAMSAVLSTAEAESPRYREPMEDSMAERSRDPRRTFLGFVGCRGMAARRWRGVTVGAPVLAASLALGAGVAGAKPPGKAPDWPKLNPAFSGATLVDDVTVCATCHEDAVRGFHGTAHANALGQEQGDANQCESCHGPRSKHVEDPTADLAFGKLTASQQSAVCLQCHQGGTRMGWKAGPHLAADVSCTSCHAVMKKGSDQALLARASATETCLRCHGELRGAGMKTSHHPVREGLMDCASCHNAHSSRPGLLVKNTLNETCTTCHTEKRGPFLWEHPPVRESCANCHEPHGSNNRSLLTQKDSFLCLTCHSYGGHINLPRYNRVSNPYGMGCVNCHITTHGSNHPSGAKQTR